MSEWDRNHKNVKNPNTVDNICETPQILWYVWDNVEPPLLFILEGWLVVVLTIRFGLYWSDIKLAVEQTLIYRVSLPIKSHLLGWYVQRVHKLEIAWNWCLHFIIFGHWANIYFVFRDCHAQLKFLCLVNPISHGGPPSGNNYHAIFCIQNMIIFFLTLKIWLFGNFW